MVARSRAPSKPTGHTRARTCLDGRSAGLLLHPTCLPGAHGSGDLGPSARAFVDFLARAGHRLWQMLPVGPVGYGASPYSATSAFAGSMALVSPEDLAREGLLEPRDLVDPLLPRDHVEHAATERHREALLRRAFAAFCAQPGSDRELARFARAEATWLDDYALFTALKREHGGVEWTKWPAPLRRRDRAALAAARQRLTEEIAFRRFCQLVFARQFDALRDYARARGVSLVGDLPIFVAHDSADVWQHPELFHLAEDGTPTVISGVPPDYFSATGQRWGNPLYRWRRMKRAGYPWWMARFRAILRRFDAVRLDHFIGFQRYWEIPAQEPTAVRGRWMKGPSSHFFQTLARELGALPLIAEDLGAVTPKVTALRDEFRLPGIKILQFAFGTDPSGPTFLPHNYGRRAVVYTGTHDNDTTVGWFHERGGEGSTRTPEETERERRRVLAYVGRANGEAIHWDLIRLAYASVADVAIVPVQDVLGQGSSARMNKPGTLAGNWSYRVEEGALDERIADRLAAMVDLYGRRGDERGR